MPIKSKTVKIVSMVNVAGLQPGQMAEVDDTTQTRDLIAAGLWTLLVSSDEISALPETPVTIAAKSVAFKEPVSISED